MRKELITGATLAVLVLLLPACESGQADNSKATSANELVTNSNTADASSAGATAVAAITFEESSYNFGKVVAGEKVRHIYKFENTGAAPLLIQSATASCGCTVPTPPKDPIPPGGTGEITVEFNSTGRAGEQVNKTITVLANTEPNTTKLSLTGEVLSDEQGPIRQ
ncbi:Protein of unknown function [Catalinimonas alkaloidigena]|uniref:DUF1573 domain-containing protein n=1 Tax=Catalinimonas alkaloidigena TaxID=1075417 RepID=A0A1G9DE68_9BACT|nr:DUF1573 domain-containing protein [Catalinimonas alkaloidigena]SDK62163.1 Protein of unknown function [Catalinimonas alkaloidigena]